MPSTRDKVEQVVKTILAPLVQADGGEIYVVLCTNEALTLHLAGRCAGCPGNTLLVRQIMEPAIRQVAPRLHLQVQWGALVPANATRI